MACCWSPHPAQRSLDLASPTSGFALGDVAKCLVGASCGVHVVTRNRLSPSSLQDYCTFSFGEECSSWRPRHCCSGRGLVGARSGLTSWWLQPIRCARQEGGAWVWIWWRSLFGGVVMTLHNPLSIDLQVKTLARIFRRTASATLVVFLLGGLASEVHLRPLRTSGFMHNSWAIEL